MATAKTRTIWVSLTLALALVPLATIAVGPAAVPVSEVFRVVGFHLGLAIEPTWEPVVEAIVWETRMPRILTGIGVGIVLAVAGVAMQALVRNPLAEPYVLGVSAGAGCGAAGAIILVGVTSVAWVSGFAFVGALAAISLVLLVGGGADGSALRLILAGLAAGFIFQALANLIIFASDSPETARAVMFWMLGSLARASWTEVWLISIVAVLVTVLLWVVAPILDALASGDRTALTVGVNPRAARMWLLIPISAAVAVAVAVAGGIGFVGLIVPHVLRSWVGTGHRNLILGSALAGGVLLVAADALGRVWFSPAEIPIGVVTGLVGAPVLLIIVRRLSGQK